MSDKPILFSAPMVRAILAGTKTQTRRVVKDAPIERDGYLCTARITFRDAAQYQKIAAAELAPYKVGDTLWVRETWYSPPRPLNDCIGYAADGDHPHGVTYRKRVSIHMPRMAARLLLRVTTVRVERLQEISETDSIAEGCKASDAVAMYQVAEDGVGRRRMRELEGTARGAYCVLWDSINAKRALWTSNPWVWVVEFERVQP